MVNTRGCFSLSETDLRMDININKSIGSMKMTRST